jgi:hypothetical protein
MKRYKTKNDKTNMNNNTANKTNLTNRCRGMLICVFVFSALLSAYAQTTLKERLEQHVYTLASDLLRGRKAGTEYARMAADYIAKQFEAIGIEPYFGDTYLQHFKKYNKFQNVVGIIRGSDPVLKNEYIVVGAHYDHLGGTSSGVYNGADDNASGVAAMIEVGRALKRNQSNLHRSVMFIAFDAEEDGLVGSGNFVFRSQAEIENIKLMIALDMIGCYKANGKLELLGSGTIKNGNEMLINPQIVPSGLNIVTKNFEKSPLFASDTQPFALKRIPTLWAFTGFKSPYHTTKDEAHLIDYDGMTLITEYMINFVETVSRDADFESSGSVAKKHQPRQRIDFGISTNIGSNIFNSSDKNDESEESDTKVSVSFGAGLVSQVNFGCFAIRPELHYDHIRTGHPSGTFATDNLTVPLSLVLQTPEYFFYVADFFFGGYYAYRFGGRQGKEKLDFENTFNRSEGGLTFGLSMTFRPLAFGVTGRFALTDFTKTPIADNTHLRNKTIYFTMRYMF